VLKPDGSLHAIRHTVAEEAPGASLSKEEAVARAEKFLREEKKVDLSHWSLVESNSDKRPHRIDHTLTWQQNGPLEASKVIPRRPQDQHREHAFARMELVVLGDEVTDRCGRLSEFDSTSDQWLKSTFFSRAELLRACHRFFLAQGSARRLFRHRVPYCVQRTVRLQHYRILFPAANPKIPHPPSAPGACVAKISFSRATPTRSARIRWSPHQ